jgi:protein SCO1
MIKGKALWVVIAVVAILGVGVFMVPRSSGATPALAGTLLPKDPAPGIVLHDQFGRPVALAQFRGRPVVVTFLRSHCLETCPIIAEDLRHSLSLLGAASAKVSVLVVSTDPEGDTPAAVQSFSRKHGMLHRWRYLIGTRAQLTPIWHAYYIYAAPKNARAALSDSHTTATYLIDPQGRERVLLTGSLDTAPLARDLQILAGLPVTALGKDARPAPEVGHPAPEVSLPSLAGSRLNLSFFRGKVVLVNFWATWCTPCRTEMPLLQRRYEQLRGKGFVVLGVDQQEPRGDVSAFLHRLHISYPVVLDESGSTIASYSVAGIPASFLVDRQGVIQSVHLGVLDQLYFDTQVAPLLNVQS